LTGIFNAYIIGIVTGHLKCAFAFLAASACGNSLNAIAAETLSVESTYFIATIAGNGVSGFSGDGGFAGSAHLKEPTAIAVDREFNIYIADSLNHRVRKVTPKGNITTVAGNGTAGYSGDGGPAASAQLNQPIGVALDDAGCLYITDQLNHRIRKVSAAGTITTLAGNGKSGYSGDGGPAIDAKIYGPSGIATDSAGNVYFADTFNNRVRKITAKGIITTIAGDGKEGSGGDGVMATNAQLYGPWGVAVDGKEGVYFADRWNNVVRMVNPQGIITTVAGSNLTGFSGDRGRATEARLREPTGVAVDKKGNLYISDSMNHRLRKVDAAGKISTMCGDGQYAYSGDLGPALAAQLYGPQGVAVDRRGNIYIADNGNNRIRKLNFSSLEAILLTDPPSAKAGDTVTATLVINNKGGLVVEGLFPELRFGDNFGRMTIQTGPNPPGPVSLAPGQTQSFSWSGVVTDTGMISLTGSVKGPDSSVGASALVTAPSGGDRSGFQPVVVVATPPPEETETPEAVDRNPAPAVEKPYGTGTVTRVVEPQPIPRQSAQAGSIMNIAVGDLQAFDVSPSDTGVIADMLRNVLINMCAQSCKVVEKQNMDKILAEQAFQATGCTQTECAVKLGHILNVHKMFVGSIGKLMGTHILSIRVVDVQSAETICGDTAKFSSIGDVEKELQNMSSRILGKLLSTN